MLLHASAYLHRGGARGPPGGHAHGALPPRAANLVYAQHVPVSFVQGQRAPRSTCTVHAHDEGLVVRAQQMVPRSPT